METLKAGVLGFFAFIVLDGLWLGVIMKNFYREQLSPIARMANGSMSPIWSVAALVYVLMGFGVAIFVIPRATGVASAAGYGALFGLATFGLYDLTNYSTLAQWPLAVTLVDITWGMITCAIGSAVVWTVVGRAI